MHILYGLQPEPGCCATADCSTDFTKKQVAFTAYDATGEQQVQLQQVDQAIEDGASVLVVNIVETGSDDAALAIIEKAKAKLEKLMAPVGSKAIKANRKPSKAIVTKVA